MDAEFQKAIDFLTGYWPLVLGISAIVYKAFSFVGSHLSPSTKEDLSLYLLGEYESSWSNQFCNLFDAAFGEKHLSLSCFLRSCLASAIFVFIIYFFMGPVFGLLEQRTGSTYSLGQVLLLGILLNLIPDYISLFETRWLLQRFNHVKSFGKTLHLLVIDVIISAGIFLPGIWLYNWFFETDQSIAHTVAAFSITSVFFYSTFFTSIWAWLYALSVLFLKLFRKTPLHRILDVENTPHKSMGLVASGLVLIIAVPFYLTIPPRAEANSTVSAFDRMMCDFFPETCEAVSTQTTDELEQLRFMIKACSVIDSKRCTELSLERYSEEDYMSAAEILDNECKQGGVSSCRSLMYLYGEGLADSHLEHMMYESYQQTCDGGDALGCTRLGLLYEAGIGVEVDYAQAYELYQETCDGGDALGCTRLGDLYQAGRGVEVDYVQAYELYQQTCDGGYASGCNRLGDLYQAGRGVEVDYAQAYKLYQQTCDGGNAWGCTRLGLLYEVGRGVEIDYVKGREFYQQGCDGGDELGCTRLGDLYQAGRGVEIDYVKGREFYQQGCDRGDALGCTRLGLLYEAGLGVEVDYAKARELYQQACDGGYQGACKKFK